MSLRLLVVGATGRTGRALLELGLSRGHHVTAFVRSPQKLARPHPHLSVVKGDPLQAEALARALPGHDAVVSALGPRPADALRGHTLLSTGAASTIPAMRAAAIRRLAVVSAAFLFPGGGPLVGLARSLLRSHIDDIRAMEDTIRRSDLGWTLVRPPRLVDSPDATYRAEVDALPSGMRVTAWLSWKGVAAFLLDSLERDLYRGQVVGICH
jgi:putative NADH-flavin reductase